MTVLLVLGAAALTVAFALWLGNALHQHAPEDVPPDAVCPVCGVELTPFNCGEVVAGVSADGVAITEWRCVQHLADDDELDEAA